MIFLDTSVALAALFKELPEPPAALWTQPLVASRLLEYEIMTRVHARQNAGTLVSAARTLIEGVRFIALTDDVLARALKPFPVTVRTLDALHLATAVFVQRTIQDITLASYDKRMCAAATALGIPLFTL